MSCLICERVALAASDNNPYLIHEFEYTIFVVGDHQYYRGYALLLLKEHVGELHQIESDVQMEMFRELMVATDALVKTFEPDKMNHLCMGNKEPHVHWHIFPRYQDDPHFGRHPLRDMQTWHAHHINTKTAQDIAATIRTNLK